MVPHAPFAEQGAGPVPVVAAGAGLPEQEALVLPAWVMRAWMDGWMDGCASVSVVGG